MFLQSSHKVLQQPCIVYSVSTNLEAPQRCHMGTGASHASLQMSHTLATWHTMYGFLTDTIRQATCQLN